MTREEAIIILKCINLNGNLFGGESDEEIEEALMMAIKALEQEPNTWNNHQIACMLEDLFGDACACNYNNIDEWLSELCDFKDTCCPNPVGVACWEQFLKHSQSRYAECGYEIRDKGVLQEPILDKIKAEIEMYELDCRLQGGTHECEKCNDNVFGSIYRIIDKYMAESEG